MSSDSNSEFYPKKAPRKRRKKSKRNALEYYQRAVSGDVVQGTPYSYLFKSNEELKPKMYSVKELAKELGISPRRVVYLISWGRIKAEKVANHHYFISLTAVQLKQMKMTLDERRAMFHDGKHPNNKGRPKKKDQTPDGGG